MDQKETAKFLKQIIGAYPSFEPTVERMEIWGRLLKEIDYDLAIKRLDNHVRVSKFPPTIAEILRPAAAIKMKKAMGEESPSPAAIMQGGYRML